MYISKYVTFFVKIEDYEDCLYVIGGHGFWYKGGVYTGVCRKKKFAAAFDGQNFFSTGV